MFEYCSLVSGSSGNCHFVKTTESRILIDVGLSARGIERSLDLLGESMENVVAVFISHVHSDHTRGLRVLMKRYGFILYAHASVLEAMELEESHRTKAIQGDVMIGEMRIKSFPLPHDAETTLGFRIDYDEKHLGIVTDLGYVPEEVEEILLPCDFLVLESNHDENLVRMGPYPYPLKQRILGEEGHLSNEAAGELIARLYKARKKLRFVMLAHLSEKNNYPELARMSVEHVLEKEGIRPGKDLLLDVAHRDHCTAIYRIL